MNQPTLATTTEATAPEPTLDELASTLFKGDATSVEEAPPAADVVTEPPTEPAKDPNAERVGSRIAAAKRAELAAARQREELRQAQAQLEAKTKELEAREKRIRVIEEDPVKFFEEFKADPKTFLEKLAGEYQPENQQAKEVAALKATVEELKGKLDAREQTAAQQAAKAQADAAWNEACAAFLGHVDEHAEQYPHLTAEFTQAEATEEAFRALTEKVGEKDGKPITRGEAYRLQYGEYPDHDVIAEFLDARAKARIESRAKSGWRSRTGEQSAAASQAKPNGDPKAAQTVKGSSPRTLRAQDASVKASPPPKTWSQESADEESLRILESAFKRT